MIRLGLIDYEQLSKRELTYQQFDSLGLLDKAVTAGVRVSHATANQIAAYWNGITVIAQMVGMLDRHLYRRVGDDDRERATTHPAYALVHDRPNPYATGMQFWTSLVGSAVSWGNGYAEIEFDRALRPVALWNIPSEWMEPRVVDVVEGWSTRRRIKE